MPELWSIEEYCSKQKDLLVHNANAIPSANADDRYWSTLLGDHHHHESTRGFLVDLNLPTVHPFCIGSSSASFGNDTSITFHPWGR